MPKFWREKFEAGVACVECRLGFLPGDPYEERIACVADGSVRMELICAACLRGESDEMIALNISIRQHPACGFYTPRVIITCVGVVAAAERGLAKDNDGKGEIAQSSDYYLALMLRVMDVFCGKSDPLTELILASARAAGWERAGAVRSA